MHLSEVRVSLCDTHPIHQGPAQSQPQGARLKAFCSITFDNTFVIRDVKLIEGNDGLFLAMPSRKLCDKCRRCGEKNHLRARFCNSCGGRLNEQRFLQYQNHNGPSRLKLHADIAHPINAHCRHELERVVFEAFREELERSRQPGYVPQSLDSDLSDLSDEHEIHGTMRLRPTGTEPR